MWTCSSPRTGISCARFTPLTRGCGTKARTRLAYPGRGDQSAAARATGGSCPSCSRRRTEKRAILARNRSASWASCCEVAVRSPMDVIWACVAAAAPSALCEEPLEIAATCCSDCASSASRWAWPRDTSAEADSALQELHHGIELVGDLVNELDAVVALLESAVRLG